MPQNIPTYIPTYLPTYLLPTYLLKQQTRFKFLAFYVCRYFIRKKITFLLILFKKVVTMFFFLLCKYMEILEQGCLDNKAEAPELIIPGISFLRKMRKLPRSFKCIIIIYLYIFICYYKRRLHTIHYKYCMAYISVNKHTYIFNNMGILLRYIL